MLTLWPLFAITCCKNDVYVKTELRWLNGLLIETATFSVEYFAKYGFTHINTSYRNARLEATLASPSLWELMAISVEGSWM